MTTAVSSSGHAVNREVSGNFDDWNEKYSKRYGRVFWKNIITGEKLWHHPREGIAEERPSGNAANIGVSLHLEQGEKGSIGGSNDLYNDRNGYRNDCDDTVTSTGSTDMTKGIPNDRRTSKSLEKSRVHTEETFDYPGWEQYRSKKHNRMFWRNRVTHESMWTRPTPKALTDYEPTLGPRYMNNREAKRLSPEIKRKSLSPSATVSSAARISLQAAAVIDAPLSPRNNGHIDQVEVNRAEVLREMVNVIMIPRNVLAGNIPLGNVLHDEKNQPRNNVPSDRLTGYPISHSDDTSVADIKQRESSDTSNRTTRNDQILSNIKEIETQKVEEKKKEKAKEKGKEKEKGTIPGIWELKHSRKSGKKYWRNTLTLETVWRIPAVMTPTEGTVPHTPIETDVTGGIEVRDVRPSAVASEVISLLSLALIRAGSPPPKISSSSSSPPPRPIPPSMPSMTHSSSVAIFPLFPSAPSLPPPPPSSAPPVDRLLTASATATSTTAITTTSAATARIAASIRIAAAVARHSTTSSLTVPTANEPNNNQYLQPPPPPPAEDVRSFPSTYVLPTLIAASDENNSALLPGVSLPVVAVVSAAAVPLLLHTREGETESWTEGEGGEGVGCDVTVTIPDPLASLSCSELASSSSEISSDKTKSRTLFTPVTTINIEQDGPTPAPLLSSPLPSRLQARLSVHTGVSPHMSSKMLRTYEETEGNDKKEKGNEKEKKNMKEKGKGKELFLLNFDQKVPWEVSSECSAHANPLWSFLLKEYV